MGLLLRSVLETLSLYPTASTLQWTVSRPSEFAEYYSSRRNLYIETSVCSFSGSSAYPFGVDPERMWAPRCF
jgi:hypothetical protein